MKLMLDLLLGARHNRYLRSRPFDNLPAQVYVRGYLSPPPFVEHASCPGGGYIGWHCSSSGIIAWDPARPRCPAHGDPAHYGQIVSMASS